MVNHCCIDQLASYKGGLLLQPDEGEFPDRLEVPCRDLMNFHNIAYHDLADKPSPLQL
jgi:hypothetical protein